MSSGRVAVGHPVDVGSGMVFTINDDFRLHGALPIVWHRSYSSQSEVDSWLGRGWSVPYFMRLEVTDSGYLLIDEDGSAIPFATQDRPLADGEMVANLSASMELRRTGNVFILQHWHAGDSRVWRYAFGPVGLSSMPLLWEENLAGHRVVVQRDPAGRPVRLTQELEQRSVELTYDHQELIVAVHHVGDRQRRLLAAFEYDSNRHLVRFTDAVGSIISYEYDWQHRLTRETGPLGGSFHFRYDRDGRAVYAAGDGGYIERHLEYHDAPKMTRVTTGQGDVTTYYLNRFGQVLQEVSPRGGITTYLYDELGRQVGILEPSGGETKYVYDDRGDRTEITDAAGGTVKIIFNEFHLPVEIVDFSGQTHTREYDARGNLIALTNPLGNRWTYVRDERGLVVLARTPGGLEVHHRYDPLLRWQESSDQFGLVQRVEFDDRGNEIAIYDAEGIFQRFAYDDLDRVVTVTTQGLGPVNFRYNAFNELVERVGSEGEHERWEYDAFGDLVTQINSQGDRFQLVNDTEGRPATIINRAGDRMERAYDFQGNVIEERFFDGRVQRYEYDLAGFRSRVILADGTVIEERRDIFGDLLERTGGDTVNEVFEYDKAGRLVKATNEHAVVEFEFDILGRLAAEAQNGRRVEYEYDVDNNKVARRLLGAGELRLSVDRRGRLSTIANSEGPVQELRWDLLDRLVERRCGGVQEAFSYNPARLVAEQVVTNSAGGVLVRRRYSYDSRGNVIDLDERENGTSRLSYDLVNRVESVVRPGLPPERYRYDPNDAIVQTHRGSRTIGAGGRTLATDSRRLTYDSLGAVVRIDGPDESVALGFDVDGQLTSVASRDRPAVTFTYDALGRRISKEVGGRRTEFQWEGSHLAAEWQDGRIRDVFLQFDHETVAHWRNGEHVLPIRDRTGAVREQIDEHGSLRWACTLDTYGNVLTERGSVASPFRFRGQYHDRDVNLHYNFYRWYAPWLADYISPDPVGLDGGANHYSYPRNPIDWDDPFGLTCTPKHKGQMGERRMDKYYKDRGFTPIHKSGRPRGIDGVYKNTKPGGKPQYIIVESKYGSSQPRRTKDGNMQLSDGWIDSKIAGKGDDRLTAAVGKTEAAKIQAAGANGDVRKDVYHAPPGSPGYSNDHGNYTPKSGNTELAPSGGTIPEH